MTTSRNLTAAELHRRTHGRPVLPRRLRNRSWNGPIPNGEGDFAWTADHVIDDPREPVITPIGLLDARGMELLRVVVPIKVKMGFASPMKQEEPDEVERIVAEDMLAVSDTGQGIGFVSPEDVGEADDFEGEVTEGPNGEPAVKLSDVIRSLTAQGLTILDDVGISR